ncbi:hypothetical protein [Halovivax limisalsi]|uniref:hypothetical protein n=1 Tax=Halovivax limisalsi TaxID=1453760 RepID=UPI001FFC66F6|nr:hypothetical protein [Halovivax limisalsi]
MLEPRTVGASRCPSCDVALSNVQGLDTCPTCEWVRDRSNRPTSNRSNETASDRSE